MKSSLMLFLALQAALKSVTVIQTSKAAVCKIADLIVSVPDAGVYNSRYWDYVVETQDNLSKFQHFQTKQ